VVSLRTSCQNAQFDTTVVEANIHHPTDTSLLADCVRVITRQVKKIKKQMVVVGTEFHDRTRSVKKRVYSIAKVLPCHIGPPPSFR
jgi:hypothetical protein